MQLNAAGQVELKLKTPWRDGTTHLVMTPLVFMQRLAALVPRPRLHLIRFHGVLAPNAKLRPLEVPQGPAQTEQSTEPTAPYFGERDRRFRERNRFERSMLSCVELDCRKKRFRGCLASPVVRFGWAGGGTNWTCRL